MIIEEMQRAAILKVLALHADVLSAEVKRELRDTLVYTIDKKYLEDDGTMYSSPYDSRDIRPLAKWVASGNVMMVEGETIPRIILTDSETSVESAGGCLIKRDWVDGYWAVNA